MRIRYALEFKCLQYALDFELPLKADASRLRSFSSSASEIAGNGVVVDDLEDGSCTDMDLVRSFVQ